MTLGELSPSSGGPTYRFCEDCGESIELHDRFCHSCGVPTRHEIELEPTVVKRPTESQNPLTDVIDHRASSGGVTCQRCSSLLGHDARFCEACGCPVDRPMPNRKAARCPTCGSDADVAGWCQVCGENLCPGVPHRYSKSAAARRAAWMGEIESTDESEAPRSAGSASEVRPQRPPPRSRTSQAPRPSGSFPTMGRDRPRRSKAWIYYALIAIAAVAAIPHQPVAILGALGAGLYSSYLFRGGRIVVWIW